MPGTAVYLASNRNLVPSALFHNLKHYHVLHEHLILVHVRTEEIPYVEPAGRLQLDRSESDLLRIDVRFGFREEPDLPAALALDQWIMLDGCRWSRRRGWIPIAPWWWRRGSSAA